MERMRKSEQTRGRIMAAAERLFAERGIDAVSLNEVKNAARQRNSTAVHYHFRNKDGLVDAILERHLAEIDERRRQLLDEQEAEGRSQDIRASIRILVWPLLEKLDRPDGRDYLRIQAQLTGMTPSPRPATHIMILRVARAIGPIVSPEEGARRGMFVRFLLFHALAERAREEEQGDASPEDRDRFAASLENALVAILTNPEDGSR